MAKTTHEIIYEQAVRAVEQQVRQLDELRARTAIILATSGVTTGFLGRAAQEKGLHEWGYAALVVFVAAAISALWVLFPRWDCWEFSINARTLKPYFLDEVHPETPEALFAYLADKIQDDYESNAELLSKLYAGFSVACCLLVVDVVLWFVAML